MNETIKEEEQLCRIAGFRYFSDLASEYYQDYVGHPDRASKQMRAGIENDEELFQLMTESHYTHKTTHLSPRMQHILFNVWGPPKIDIHYTLSKQEVSANNKSVECTEKEP